MNQYRLTPEQAIEQDARYYNPSDYDEKLAFDLDPDRHTPAEFWGVRKPAPVAPVEPVPDAPRMTLEEWIANEPWGPEYLARREAKAAERARQDKVMLERIRAITERKREADAIRDSQ